MTFRSTAESGLKKTVGQERQKKMKEDGGRKIADSGA
jgi:hypothetical protein